MPTSLCRIQPVDRVKNTQPAADIQKHTGKIKEPNILNIMIQFVNITSYQALKYGIAGADVVIKPGVADISFSDFKSARVCIFQGELAAQASMPEIKQLLSD